MTAARQTLAQEEEGHGLTASTLSLPQATQTTGPSGDPCMRHPPSRKTWRGCICSCSPCTSTCMPTYAEPYTKSMVQSI